MAAYDAFRESSVFQSVAHTSDGAAVSRDGLPADLAAIYAALDPGAYGDGLFWLGDPALMNETFGPWMNPRPGVSMLPFGRSAFGDVFYVAFTDTVPPSPGVLDVHYKTMRPAYATSLADFFDRVLLTDSYRAEELRELRFRQARDSLGDLEAGECYHFVPALALGGSEDGELAKGDWAVHLELLRQL